MGGIHMRVIKGVFTTLFAAGLLQAAQFCNLSFNACLKDFSGTVTVPKEAIWLDPVIPVCSEQVQVTKQVGAPPSIVFILDNSGSMDNTDPNEQRFSVTQELLDTLYAKAKHTEVALAIFSRRLSFDTRDNPYYKAVYPGDTSQHDAYFPLTALDTVFPNGVTGIDSLKRMLANNNGNLTHATCQPSSRANSHNGINKDQNCGQTQGQFPRGTFDVRNGTDISLGFDAGREAMKAARKGQSKDNEFFVFLSDGNPSSLDDSRTNRDYEFVSAAASNTPTTFTVFFLDQGANATDSIQKMTNNIKTNAYSPTSNPKSAYYEANLTGSGELAPLLLNNILNTILSTYKATAGSATLTKDGGAPVSAVTVDAKNFTFPARIPLDPNQTSVQLKATYHFTDSAGKAHDTLFTYTLNIQRSNVSKYPGSVSGACYDAPDIQLFDDHGQEIHVVTADNDSVQVRVTLPTGETCNNCKAGATPSHGGDSESVGLSPASGIISGILHRAATNSQIPNNNILEHLTNDSIVITFTNPANPLETVREAFPFNNVNTTLSAGPIQFDFDNRAQPVSTVTVNEQTHWVVAGTSAVKLEDPSKPDAWQTVDPTLPEVKNDSSSALPWPGIKIEASRSFRTDVWVFTNFGEFVDKFSFNIPQIEFDKLPKGNRQNTRILKLYWIPKSLNGRAAATGAYIVKYNITLNKIPGIAEDSKVTSDVKTLGYMRPH